MQKIKDYIKKIQNVFNVVLRNYLRITKTLWKNDKKLLFFTYSYSFINSLSPIVNAFIYGAIVNLVIQGIEKKTNIESPLLILFGIWFLVYYISNYLGSYYYIIWNKIQLLLSKLYTQLFLEKLNNIDVKTIYDSEFYDYFNKAQDRYQFTASNLANQVFRLNTAILSFIFSISVFFYFSPLIALLIILAFIPSIIYEINFSKMSWGIWDESTEYRTNYYSTINIFRRDNTQELKIHRAGDYLKDKVNTLNQERYDKEMKLTGKRTKFNIFGAFMDTAIYILTSLYIVYEALQRIIPIGSIVTFLSILGSYISSTQYLTESFIQVYTFGLYLDDIHIYLDFELVDSIKNGDIDIKSNKNHKIEFRNVSFKYPKSKRYVFKDLSLTINPGERIAIIGENGAGKSTFINLLCRFYDVDKGEILVDGINIKDIDIYTWYNNIGVLFQDYINYHFSVKENIYLGKIENKDTNISNIINSAKKGGAHKFVNSLEDKYDTILNTRGEGLSGGQWQKLALSREFFRDPNILILDEPTSNLDAKSEDEIFKIIGKETKDNTVILISHRFSTVRNADKIFVFEKGKILEEGNHRELINLKGKYSELFNLQAKGYQ